MEQKDENISVWVWVGVSVSVGVQERDSFIYRNSNIFSGTARREKERVALTKISQK